MISPSRHAQRPREWLEEIVLAQLLMDVQPIKREGAWWVTVNVNGRPMNERGPFANETAAKTAAAEFIKHWTPATSPTGDDVIILNGTATKLDSTEGRRFVTDATRAAEGLIDDKTIREIYEITPENWANIAKNVALGRAIRDQGRQRVRSGQTAREAAQQHFVKAPTVLDSIMSDAKASPRHRIEAAREIRQVAIGTDGAESTPADAAEKFTIIFNLGADHVEKIEKMIDHRPKQLEEGELDANSE
jgi:hypothetical protein